MPTTYRDRWAKVRKAIPTNDDEATLYRLAGKELERELLAKAVVEELAQQERKPGAPRKTGDDVQLAGRLLAEHGGDTKLARQEFIRIMGNRGECEPKRARARFKTAVDLMLKKT
jgi:hypothetical protein